MILSKVFMVKFCAVIFLWQLSFGSGFKFLYRQLLASLLCFLLLSFRFLFLFSLASVTNFMDKNGISRIHCTGNNSFVCRSPVDLAVGLPVVSVVFLKRLLEFHQNRLLSSWHCSFFIIIASMTYLLLAVTKLRLWVLSLSLNCYLGSGIAVSIWGTLKQTHYCDSRSSAISLESANKAASFSRGTIFAFFFDIRLRILFIFIAPAGSFSSAIFGLCVDSFNQHSNILLI